MTTFMTRLVVQRPRNQRDEVFATRKFDHTVTFPHLKQEVLVYSYRVLSGNVMKVYAHKASLDNIGRTDWPTDGDAGFEVAHFRPNQWDMVRDGS